MQRIEAHYSSDERDCLGRATVVDQHQSVAAVGQIRVELERSLELSERFTAAILPM